MRIRGGPHEAKPVPTPVRDPSVNPMPWGPALQPLPFWDCKGRWAQCGGQRELLGTQTPEAGLLWLLWSLGHIFHGLRSSRRLVQCGSCSLGTAPFRTNSSAAFADRSGLLSCKDSTASPALQPTLHCLPTLWSQVHPVPETLPEGFVSRSIYGKTWQ